MCPVCKDRGYVGGTQCPLCNEDVCIHTAVVKTQFDSVYGIEYKYLQDGNCPYCGGSVVVEDGYLTCVSPGSCTYSQEIE